VISVIDLTVGSETVLNQFFTYSNFRSSKTHQYTMAKTTFSQSMQTR
jgi:hypothetical protein